MKRLPIYTLLLLLLFACKEKESNIYTIKGESVKEGTVYLLSTDESHRKLLSTNSNGSFAMSIALDEAAHLALILPDGKLIPLFAEPGTTATLQPDTILKSGWYVDGGSTQALHDSISRVLDSAESFDKQKKIIEDFASKNPLSEVNVELYRRYLISVPTPDNEYIRKATSKLSGALQDHPYFLITGKHLEKKTGNVMHRMFPTFNYTTADGRKVSLGTYSDKYLLVNIWATWSGDSHKCVKNLRNIKEKVESENFAILNISLDSDTAIWKSAITNDSIIGDNVIDIKGMNSEILETFNITSLPYSVLVTPYKRIAEYEVTLDSLAAARIDSLTHRHDTRNERNKKKK